MSKKRKQKIYRQRHYSQPQKIWFYANITLAVMLIFVGIWLLFWLGNQASSKNMADAAPRPAGQIGLPAPNFNLLSPTGESITLSDYEGQVVLVNMWATWCPPCKAELPDINAFYEAHKGEGFVVLAVNSQEDAATVDAFIQAKGFRFPVALDSRGEVMNLYQAPGLPTTYIIDRNGAIRHIQTGAITKQQLETIIGPLLTEL
jgi:cytochrome c biogenesis protein CcmG/thiol:disulfide interchange protein DsbE